MSHAWGTSMRTSETRYSTSKSRHSLHQMLVQSLPNIFHQMLDDGTIHVDRLFGAGAVGRRPPDLRVLIASPS